MSGPEQPASTPGPDPSDDAPDVQPQHWQPQPPAQRPPAPEESARPPAPWSPPVSNVPPPYPAPEGHPPPSGYAPPSGYPSPAGHAPPSGPAPEAYAPPVGYALPPTHPTTHNPFAAPPPGSPPPQGHGAYLAAGYVAPRIPREQLAPWWPRVGAFVLDGLLQNGPLLLVYLGLIGTMAATGGNAPDTLAIPFLLGFLLASAWSIGWWVFDRVVRQGTTGQSVGKRVIGIRLLTQDDLRPPGAGMTLGRELAHLLDAYSLYIGFLWPLWDDHRQTFADKICRTLVVRG